MGFLKDFIKKKEQSEDDKRVNGNNRSFVLDGNIAQGWEQKSQLEDNSDFESILNDIFRFRYQGFAFPTRQDSMSDLEKYDQPNWYFFKIFFYFNNEDKLTGNLLSQSITTSVERQYAHQLEDLQIKYDYQEQPVSVNTAMNYLLSNAELERARNLSKFIDLLQEINTTSPWYFQSISGLDEFMKKDYMFGGNGLDIKDERKQITIKCLADSVDDRIGTLMDLYRSACYSEVNKKEVVPANLRKFDMGIYIMSVPARGLNTFLKTTKKINGPFGQDIEIATDVSPKIPHVYSGHNDALDMKVSCKYIELLNCEIDPSCISQAYSEVNATERFQMTYDLKIWADDMKEDRYNQFLCYHIGDFVKTDLQPDLSAIDLDYPEMYLNVEGKLDFNRTIKEAAIEGLDGSRRGKKDVLRGWPGSPKKQDGYLAKSIKGIIKSGTNFLKSKVERLLLGNIYQPTTVNKIEMGISALAAPNIQGTITRGAQIFKKNDSKKMMMTKNIYRNNWNVQNNTDDDINPNNINN